ncbi:hypothetical protein HRbin16_00051 [bacterium HR16]|nr:hypothetical protein HRbin16_00051 [bacterium HR16]
MEELTVTIGAGGEQVDLNDISQLANHFCKAIRELARELTGQEKPRVDIPVVRVASGSVAMTIGPMSRTQSSESLPLAKYVFEDLSGILAQTPRPTMSVDLYRAYTEVIRAPRNTIPYSVLYGKRFIEVNEQVRQQVHQMSEYIRVPHASVVGTIESVNIHRMPYVFMLYTKVEPRQHVECRFRDDEFLPAVTDILKSRKMAEIKGTAYYAPVGIFPLRIDVEEQPMKLEYSPEDLLSYVGRLHIVPEGVTVEKYLEREWE